MVSTPNAGSPRRGRVRANSTGAGVPQPAPYSATAADRRLHSDSTVPLALTSRSCAPSHKVGPFSAGMVDVAIDVQVTPSYPHSSYEAWPRDSRPDRIVRL